VLPARYAASSSAAQSEMQWPLNGHDGNEHHCSPARQIDDSNFSELGLEWFLDLPGEGALEATSLEVDGTIDFPGGMSVIYAGHP
jgi:hypothetical protein